MWPPINRPAAACYQWKSIAIRRRHQALRHGDYVELHVAHEQFAFMRRAAAESIIVALNASPRTSEIPLKIPYLQPVTLVDVLNDGAMFELVGERPMLSIPPRSAQILLVK